MARLKERRMFMSRNEILKKMIDLFSSLSDAETITEDSELLDDLDLSSIDMFFLLAKLETEYKFKVSEKMIRKIVTVGDVVDIIQMNI